MLLANLGQIVDEVLEIGQEEIRNAGIDLRLDITKDLSVGCSAAELGQIILN